MVMTKTRRAKPKKSLRTQDPILWLEAKGYVTRGNSRLVSALNPHFRQILGRDYRTRFKKVPVIELRMRLGEHMRPGEKLSDLVIQMREE